MQFQWPPATTGLIHRSRYYQNEFRNRDIELFPFTVDHLILAAHGAKRCGQGATRSIFKRLSRFEHWLLTHDPLAVDLFYVTARVSDDPVPRQQLDRFRAFVCYADAIGKEPLMARGGAPFRNVLASHLNANVSTRRF